MAKLSTPYHQCATRYVDDKGVPTGHKCPFPAYKRLAGRWLCRTCLRRAKARAAAQAPAFEVVGIYLP